MNGRLPRDLDGPALVRALKRIGFVVDRQSGSHAVIVHPQDPSRDVVIPIHPSRPLALGTLSKILRRARVTPDELADLL